MFLAKDPNQLKLFEEKYKDRLANVIHPKIGLQPMTAQWVKPTGETEGIQIVDPKKRVIPFAEVIGADKAALAKSPEGGIDLNSRNLNMESEGQKVNIAFDPAMIAQFRRGDFSGVRIQILDVVPVNLMPLLGLKEDEEPVQLAKV